ncbi:MAG: glycosyltransferase family 4 protein [Acidimicrobiia bacterium]|nr:glycosyltransferase family 4 protein [Acidimicrobiia bacterium]
MTVERTPDKGTPLHVVVVSHYFPPEIGAPQARLGEMARMWATAGDDVTVLTGMPNHPTGVIPEEYRGKVRIEESTEGYRVVRTCLYATPNSGFAKKIFGHLTFMVSSVVLGWRRIGRPDVIIVSSPTFFSIFSAWFLARIKRSALIVEVRDLWPAIFVELGVLTNPILIRILERLELAAYHAADHVVVVSEGFRDDLIERGVPAGKVTTITNGADLERFDAVEAKPEDRAWLGAGEDDVLVLYIGAHGISHGLDTVAEACAQLDGDKIHVAFVGEGAAKPALVDKVSELGVSHISLHDGVPAERVADLLAVSDICLVPLRDVSLFSSFIPSKIFEYLAAGKAVVGSVEGEPANILREAGAVVVAPEDVPALAAAIAELADDEERRRSMAAAGRVAVAERFDRRVLAGRYRELMSSVLQRRAG